MTRLRFRHIAILLATVMCVIYLTYRAAFTLNLTTPYAVFAALFLYVGECYSILLFLLYFFQAWEPVEPPEQPVLEGRSVDVLVPTYNEDVHLLRTTLLACVALDYPHRTYVLDDGRRPEVKTLAEELGVEYLTRPDNRHAKAGNLNHALEKTTGEFVIIFDADHVPEPHFITRLIGYFSDDQLAFVQTPHAFYNFDSFQARFDHRRRVYWEEGQLFYNVIQPGKNYWNAAIFAGSAAIFRRRALESIGYIAAETITEDLHTSLRLHAKGWKSLAVSERLIAGQAAPDVTTFHSQRLRWGEGNLSVMAYDNPITMRGLTLAQRICYLGSMIHWAGGLFMLTIYLTPLLMLVTGVPPVAEFTWTLMVITGAYLTISLTAAWIVSNGYWSFWNAELYLMAGFWTQVRGTLRALFRRRFQRFVVTSKRGRQSKNVWPFIKAHVYLIGGTILALAWGWYRPYSGISDDYWRPLLATLWALFHVSLAVAVIRRSLYPEDHRFAYRHTVYLPVVYEADGAGGGPRYGITADLSEGGLALVAYERFKIGTRLRLTLHGAGEAIEATGQIMSVKELGSGRRAPGTLPGYRYGVAFTGLAPHQVDAINRICFGYAVPLLYEEYETGRERTFGQRLAARLGRGFQQRREARRRYYRLPVVLSGGDLAERAEYAVTDDISRSSLRTLLDTPLTTGEELDFLLPLPVGDVRGKARVLRSEPHRVGGREFHVSVLEFTQFEGQGRVTLQTLVTPGETPETDAVLNPDKEPVQVPIGRPVLLGMVACVPVLLAEMGLFHFVYRDDFFLLAVREQNTPLSAEQEARLEHIFHQTMAQRYPATDRLVLLEDTLVQLRRPDQVAAVTRVLALRDKGNVNLQLALAQAYDNSQEYAAAETEYQRLLQMQQRGRLTPAQERELLLASARSAVHAGQIDAAVQRFQQLLREETPGNELRNEFAGVLIRAGKYGEAAQLYDGVQPDLDGQLMRVTANLLRHDYAAAEREARAVLARRPDDLRAQTLLATVLAAEKNYTQARLIYDRLLKANPTNPEVRVRLGQLALATHNYDQALELFQQLLDSGMNRPDVVKGYIDAAASAPNLAEAPLATVQRIYDQAVAGPSDDAVFLARLAWVMQRLKEPDKALYLLDRALGQRPNDPALRNQFIGALLSADRWKDAISFLKNRPADLESQRLLVSLYLKGQDFAAAEKECRAILKANPDDEKTELLLADVLSWQKHYKESLALLEKLNKAHPADRDLQARLAEVTLWSGDYPVALARYQDLLNTSFDQPTVWPGFINAAASAKALTDENAKTARRILGRITAEPSKDPLLLARLAWVLSRTGDTEQAAKLAQKVAGLEPKDPAVRRELAGILAALGQNKLALRMFQGLPLTREDRFTLVGIYSADKDFDAAVAECRRLLQEDPKDRKAERLLADVLTWKRDYPAALALLQKMAEAQPADESLRARLAEVTLWSGDYAGALAQYQKLLATKFEQPELWRGYVDAAAGVMRLTDEQARLAQRIAERVASDPPKNALFLARLAWVLKQIGDREQALKLLDDAVALDPKEPAVRRELAGVLAALGFYQRAAALYEGIDLTDADRFHLVGIYSAEKDFAAAEKQARALLAIKPDDRSAQVLLADVLSWRGKYTEAAALLQKLLAANPANTSIAIKLADVALWSGDYDSALRQYQKLLDEDPKQKQLWVSYIDAASSAEKISPSAKKMVLNIYDNTMAGKPKDVVFLTRLSWVLRRLKEPQNAVKVLERALALQPDSRQIKLQLAETLYALGKYNEAERYYNELARAKK